MPPTQGCFQDSSINRLDTALKCLDLEIEFKLQSSWHDSKFHFASAQVPLKQYQVDLHRHTKAFLQLPHICYIESKTCFNAFQTSVLQKSHKHFTFIPKKLNKCNQHTLPQFSTCSQLQTNFKSSALMRVAAQQPARPVTIRSTARAKDMASTRVVENGFPNQKQKKTTETGAFHPGWGSSGLYFGVGPQ